MKKINKTKALRLEKFKIAKINNAQNIWGGNEKPQEDPIDISVSQTITLPVSKEMKNFGG